MRSFVVDTCKAIAAQLIVLHHLSAYGPVAAVIERSLPQLSHLLFDYARMAVQVFIVIGGYLAARSLDGAPERSSFPAALYKRYIRLVVPFVAALTLTTVMAAVLRPWFNDDALPVAPTLGQVFAHVFLLHGVLDFESLSAGAWYVAIDFQLFALFAFLVWSNRRTLFWQLGFVLLLTLASLFYYNRDSNLDNWAVYFFGAYGLGVLAFHISRSTRPLTWLAMLVTIATCALWVDFRGRILVATCAAIALVLLRNVQAEPEGWLARRISYFSVNSYSLFLVHFSFCLLGNALFAAMGWHSTAEGLAMMALILIASNLFADFFCRYVEAAASRFVLPRRVLSYSRSLIQSLIM